MPEPLTTPVFITGKYASLTIGGQPVCMESWDLEESAEPIDVTTWCSPRDPLDNGVIRAEYEPGLIDGSFNMSGPYRGVTPSKGDIVEITFGVNATINIKRKCLIQSIKVATELRGKATVTISGKIVGLPAAP